MKNLPTSRADTEKVAILTLQNDSSQRGFTVTVSIANGKGKELASEEGYLVFPKDGLKQYEHWRNKLRNFARFSQENDCPRVEYDFSIDELYLEEKRVQEDFQKSYKKQEKEIIDFLNDWLRSPSFQKILSELDNEISQFDRVRMVVRTNDCKLKKLPWEKWNWLTYGQRQGRLFFCPITYKRKKQAHQEVLKAQIILNATAANKTELDQAFFEHIFTSAKGFELLPTLVNPSKGEVYDCLKRRSFQIFYFGGHSQKDGEVAKIHINDGEFLEIGSLVNHFKQVINNGLKLAIFNSCESLELEAELGKNELQIPNLIAMRDILHDEAAHNFLQDFLKSFIEENQPLHVACDEARQNLERWDSQYPGSSLMPVLLQTSAEPQYWEDWLLPSLSPPRPIFNPFVTGVVSSLMVTLLIVGVRSLGGFQALEFLAFDFLMQQRPIEGVDRHMLVVQVTESDLQNLKEPILSDATVTQLIEKLQQNQPRVIGLDIYRDIPSGEGRNHLIRQFQQTESLVAVCNVRDVFDRSEVGDTPPAGVPLARLGFTDFVLDSDRVIRRHLLQMEPDFEAPCPARYAFSFQLAVRYLKQEGIVPQSTPSGFLQLGEVVFHPWEPPLGGYQRIQPMLDLGGYQILLNYRPYKRIADIAPEVTATAVLKGAIARDEVRDKIVLIGYGEEDLHRTPYGELPGIFLHAQMVSQMINAVEGNRPLLRGLPWWGDVLGIWGGAVVGSILAWRLHSFLRLGLGGGLALVFLYGLCLGFLKRGWWMPLIPAGLAIGLAILVTMALSAHQQQQKR